MESKAMHSRKELGGSLPVANVQELASSNNLKDIPLRYIRPELNNLADSEVSISMDESLQIPVIDMSKLATDHPEYQHEMAKLHQACKEWGFFQLINHGATTAIKKMKVDIEDFFKLPLEQKKAYAQLPTSIEGYGQAFVIAEDQKLDWADMLFLKPSPISQRNMRFWPKTPTSFRRSTLDEYSVELHKVCMSLLKNIAVNLGLDSESFSSMYDYEDCTQAIRMNYYPPCPEADKVIGLTPHSDASGLTLLVQMNEVQGLQIKKNAKWVPIKPIPEAIIINIGDIMEIMSNGEYSSIEHRAVVDFKKERLSIAAFHSPTMSTEVGPLPDLVKENGANYKTLKLEEFLRQLVTNKLAGKSLPESMKIKE